MKYVTDEATKLSAKRRAALRVANLWGACFVWFAHSIDLMQPRKPSQSIHPQIFSDGALSFYYTGS